MPAKEEPEPVHVMISGRNMPISEPLRKYAESKMQRLNRYLDRLARIEVVLTSEHTRSASSRNVAEATATVKGHVFRAESADGDMYAAIDGLVDKLHLQLTKTKEKRRDHKRHGHATEELEYEAGPVTDDDFADSIVSEDAPSVDNLIVEVKRYDMKPMFPEEAIEEMNELGHAFFVFLHSRTERVSVVYRRRDGLYGLIEPAG